MAHQVNGLNGLGVNMEDHSNGNGNGNGNGIKLGPWLDREDLPLGRTLSLSLDWPRLLEYIKCKGCSRVPHPDWRYLCLNGHMYCFKCGEERECSHDGLCHASMDKEILADEETKAPCTDLKDDDSKTDATNEIADQAEGICQLKLKKCKADPVYYAILTQCKWQCPNHVNGCRKVVIGSKIFNHYDKCRKGEQGENLDDDEKQKMRGTRSRGGKAEEEKEEDQDEEEEENGMYDGVFNGMRGIEDEDEECLLNLHH